MSLLLYDFSDAPDSCGKHLVSLREGILNQKVAIEIIEFFIIDNQQAVNIFLKLVDSVNSFGSRFATLALERQGDHSHGKDALLLCHCRNHRRSTGTRTAAHSSCNEKHFSPFKSLCSNLILGIQGCITAFCRVTAGAQTFSELDLDRDSAALKCLSISVADYEGTALDSLPVHIIDGIATAATYSDDLDDGFFRNPVSRGDIHVFYILIVFHCQSSYACGVSSLALS